MIRDSYVLPVDVELLAVQPHAHYRAREIRGVATLPDGSSRVVMDIRDWDFRWQHVYRHESPIALPKGTRLSMEYTYDNSADNPRNPQLPPARVYWGQRSQDEMGDLWFQLLAANESERRALNAEITAKMTAEDIVGYETMLKVTPDDAELHDDVALLYLGMGMAANAVRHFELSAALKPDSAPAQFNLGTALAQAGLGRVLLAQNDVGEALKHLQEAVRLDPANPRSLLGLAEALAARGAYDVAVETIERAMKLPLTEDLAKEIFAKRAEFLKLRKG